MITKKGQSDELIDFIGLSFLLEFIKVLLAKQGACAFVVSRRLAPAPST